MDTNRLKAELEDHYWSNPPAVALQAANYALAACVIGQWVVKIDRAFPEATGQDKGAAHFEAMKRPVAGQDYLTTYSNTLLGLVEFRISNSKAK